VVLLLLLVGEVFLFGRALPPAVNRRRRGGGTVARTTHQCMKQLRQGGVAGALLIFMRGSGMLIVNAIA
jgi:hypothetical protein